MNLSRKSFKVLRSRRGRVFVVLFALGGLIAGTSSFSDGDAPDVSEAERTHWSLVAAAEGISTDAAIERYACLRRLAVQFR